MKRSAVLVALVAVLCWWPWTPWTGGTYFQSDDFFALPYASDWRNVLHDFVGPRYSLPPVVVFWRPLITLSFWVDVQLFGAHPFGPHLQNALVHGLNALLVFCLVARLIGRRVAPAGLLWAIAPSHAAALLWTVGRVDTHGGFFFLLALLCAERVVRLRRGQGLLVAVFVLGLMTKEQLMPLPAAAWIVAFAAAAGGAWRERARVAARVTWPLFGVLASYLAWRRLVLGHWIGGYVEPPLRGEGLAALANLVGDGGNVLLSLLCPARTDYFPHEIMESLPSVPEWHPAAAPWMPRGLATGLVNWSWLLVAAALIAGIVRLGLRRVLALAGLALVLAVPVAGFFKAYGDVATLRYYYLALVPLLIVMAAAPWPLLVVPAAIALLTMSGARLEYGAAHATIAERHRAMLQTQRLLAPGEDGFYAGLVRRAGPEQTAIAFHMGQDRLLDAPFGDGRHGSVPLQPITTHYNQRTLSTEELADGLGRVFVFDAQFGRFALRVAARPALPTFPVDFPAPAVITARDLAQQAQDPTLRFTFRGQRSQRFRVTALTPYGTMTAILPDAGTGSDGGFSFRDFMLAPVYEKEPPDRQAYVLDGFYVAVGVSKSGRSRLLIEALDDAGRFVARADRLVPITFDHGYIAWRQGPASELGALACLLCVALAFALRRHALAA